jgi:hypothetical protein
LTGAGRENASRLLSRFPNPYYYPKDFARLAKVSAMTNGEARMTKE